MRIDMALSFLYFYSDWHIDFYFYNNYNGIFPDMTVKMKKGDKELVFLVEIENKDKADKTYKEKLLKYEQKIPDFEAVGLPKFTKILFSINYLYNNPLIRHCEYSDTKYAPMFASNEMILNTLLNNWCKDLPNRYLFTTFDNYYRINQPIWFNVKKELCKIVN
jgi:hypothetical protein